MYVTRVPNRSTPPAVLLRESWREGGKVKTRTLANLTDWPEAKVEALRRVLRGETLVVRRPLRGRALAVARSCGGGARHGARDRSRPPAAAAARAACQAGPGTDRRARDRADGEAGDGAAAERGDGFAFAGRGFGL